MKFDPYAFAEKHGIEAGRRAICAISTTPVSTNSTNSTKQAVKTEIMPAPDPTAQTAQEAPELCPAPTAQPPSAPGGDFRHGVCPFTGKPRTWTGRVVSLEAWRELSGWERHGSTGKLWNGLTRQWGKNKGGNHGR